MLQITVSRRHLMVFMAVVALMVSVAWVGVAQRASAASATPAVYVATGENFPDALGAAAAAAVQGGPVLLVTETSIPAETKAELSRLSPDVIYVAGGTMVVSDTVFNQLKVYAGSVVRVAGANRYSTAVEVSKSAFPVTSSGGGDLTALTAAVNALTTRVDALEADNAALEGEVGGLQALLAGVSRSGSTLLFTGMNLQVVNGQGSTSTSNSVGSVIIGYNEDSEGLPNERTGSHYLVIGPEHTWTMYGGIVAGSKNTVRGQYASVTGGSENWSGGSHASVTGGYYNSAREPYSSVTGGYQNGAIASYASVSGGNYNHASGNYSSVTGGYDNTASGRYAYVIGGTRNEAAGELDGVLGGDDVTCDAINDKACGEATVNNADA